MKDEKKGGLRYHHWSAIVLSIVFITLSVSLIAGPRPELAQYQGMLNWAIGVGGGIMIVLYITVLNAANVAMQDRDREHEQRVWVGKNFTKLMEHVKSLYERLEFTPSTVPYTADVRREALTHAYELAKAAEAREAECHRLAAILQRIITTLGAPSPENPAEGIAAMRKLATDRAPMGERSAVKLMVERAREVAERSRRFEALQAEIASTLGAMVNIANELRRARVDLKGAHYFVDGREERVRWRDWTAGMRRPIVSLLLHLVALSQDEMPHELTGLPAQTARDVADTRRIRTLLAGEQAPSWGAMLLGALAPPAFEDVAIHDVQVESGEPPVQG